MVLKTDYKDDILNTSLNEKRKYQLVYNDDGTVHLNDATVYEQVGDTFAALDVNLIASEVNNKLDKSTGGTVTGDVEFSGSLTKNSKQVATYERGTCDIYIGGNSFDARHYSFRRSIYTIVGNICTVYFTLIFIKDYLPTTAASLILRNLPVMPKNYDTNQYGSHVYLSNFGASPIPSPQAGDLRVYLGSIILNVNNGISRYSTVATTAQLNTDTTIRGSVSYEI